MGLIPESETSLSLPGNVSLLNKIGISPLYWSRGCPVCLSSVDPVPHTFLYNVFFNTLLGWDRRCYLQGIDVFVSQDYLPEFSKKVSL